MLHSKFYIFDYFQKSDNADYSKFLDALVHKRREVADQNSIKLDTIHSANGVTTLGSPGAVPTKSIIIGAGKPIVPVQKEKITIESRTDGLLKNMLEEKLQKTKLIAELPTTSGQIRSVDEFCPEDGSNLDKSFLDDIVDSATRNLAAATIDSDSETEGFRGNPLVAQFDEDCFDLGATSTPVKTATQKDKKPKVNPLSKGHKNRSSSEVEVFNITSITGTSYSRRSSSSSLEIKGRNESSSFVEFDSDSSKLDSKIRRSPDGIEDTTTMTPAACTSLSIPDIETDEADSKKKHKKKSKEHKEKSAKKEKREKKTKKKKSKDVSTSEDDTTKHEAYEII